MKTVGSRHCLLVCCLMLAPFAWAQQQTYYELGVGAGGLWAPHYPGADEYHGWLVPVPYVIYRSEHIEADRDGIRARLAGSDRLDLSLSLAAGLPVDSEDNEAREDMPDLDMLLEAGPVLRYTLFERDQGQRLRFEWPLRAAFALDGLTLRHRGWVSTPGLAYTWREGDWRWGARLSAMVGDGDYQSYFYQVDQAYATAGRPVYDARSGYMGSSAALSVTRRTGNWFVGGVVRGFALDGAANEHSPLMRDRHNVFAGFMVAWVFATSGGVDSAQ